MIREYRSQGKRQRDEVQDALRNNRVKRRELEPTPADEADQGEHDERAPGAHGPHAEQAPERELLLVLRPTPDGRDEDLKAERGQGGKCAGEGAPVGGLLVGEVEEASEAEELSADAVVALHQVRGGFHDVDHGEDGENTDGGGALGRVGRVAGRQRRLVEPCGQKAHGEGWALPALRGSGANGGGVGVGVGVVSCGRTKGAVVEEEIRMAGAGVEIARTPGVTRGRVGRVRAG